MNSNILAIKEQIMPMPVSINHYPSSLATVVLDLLYVCYFFEIQ